MTRSGGASGHRAEFSVGGLGGLAMITNRAEPSEGKFAARESAAEEKAGGAPLARAERTPAKIPVALWLLLLSAAVVGVLVFLLGSGNKGPRAPGRLSPSKTIAYNGREINFYSKSDWKARPPTSGIRMKTPVRYVVVSHSATKPCHDETTCATLLRNVQASQMSRSPPLPDISHSFLVGGDGGVYEGRGWTTKNSIAGFASNRNVDIAFVGNFEKFDFPTFSQTEAAKALIEYGVRNSYIDANYTLIAANATAATLSPGARLYREIETWPHFDPSPETSPKEQQES